jgi:hypothetical protein
MRLGLVHVNWMQVDICTERMNQQLARLNNLKAGAQDTRLLANPRFWAKKPGRTV